MAIKIFTDTNADLCRELREQYDIDYFKMCTVHEGKVTPADMDWEQWTPKQFYDILRGGKRVTTTQVPAEEFRKGFAKCLEEGDTAIYIGCALPLSSSVNTAAVVARDLLVNYPEGKIFCVDSRNCCFGEAMLAILAAELRDAGKSAEEIVAAVEKKRDYINQYVTVGSLDMLKKSGRVKGSAAFFGNLLGVKPIIISDLNGQNVPICKIKGRNASLDKLIDLTRASVIDPTEQIVYISHADCAETAEYLKQKALEIGFADARIGVIGPVVGACIGPDAVGIWSFGKKVELAI